MRKLKALSGNDVVKILSSFGFTMAAQKGSHIKLRRILPDGNKQILTVPNHREFDRGTLHAIHRQASRYIPEQELAQHFFAV